jgi:hypothetical protein
MSDLLFQFFDCDNHYYEATDAFTRHLAPGFAKRTMQWAQIGGKTRLLVGGKINRFIPNPTFDPVARPGAMDEYFRGRNPRKVSTIELFGELEPIRPEYRDRDARLARRPATSRTWRISATPRTSAGRSCATTAWLWPPGSPDIRAPHPQRVRFRTWRAEAFSQLPGSNRVDLPRFVPRNL